MVSLCRLNLITYIISFTFCHCAAIEAVCSAALFGVPPWDDCIAAFDDIPFAPDYTTRTAALFELYGEPQYIWPHFGRVINRYRPRPINQIPKIWQHSRLYYISGTGASLKSHHCIDLCRIAFMSYGIAGGRAIKPLFGASWKRVLEQLEKVKECIHPVQAGAAAGGWIPFYCKLDFGLASGNSLPR